MKIKLCLTILLLTCLQMFAQQKIYICTSGQEIYKVNISDCTSQLIGPSGTELWDIAVTPNGKLWGNYDDNFYSIDTLTGAATFVGVIGFTGSALIDLNDTTLLMAGGTTGLYKINVTTGSATFIGLTGYPSGGDLTWYDNDLYLVATPSGILVKIQLNSTYTAIVSSTAINTSTNPIPLCWGAVTSPFAHIPNQLLGFAEQNAYRICPFDGSYQLLCDSIIAPPYYINGAAAIRLPVQNPIPTNCDTLDFINEYTLLQGFEIYPNPTSGQFTIILQTDNAEIRVTNILGQLLLKTQTTQKTTNLQFDNNGVYIVYVTTKQGTTTRKLVVNR